MSARAVAGQLARQSLKNGYEITVEERDARFDAQKHACAVCQRPFRTPGWHLVCSFTGKLVGRRIGTSPNVDHDHKTGAVRGLLCRFCNRDVVSMVERHRNAVQRAIQYVDRGGFTS